MRSYSRYQRIKERDIGSSTKADRTRLCPFGCRIKFDLKSLDYVDYSELGRENIAMIQLGKGNLRAQCTNVPPTAVPRAIFSSVVRSIRQTNVYEHSVLSAK